ncbi:MAG: histidine kinase [Treponema sp.]|nr:histidine kinase [Treponema sp.]
MNVSIIKKLNTNFRLRIFICVIAAIVVIAFSFLFMINMNRKALERIGRTYETNRKLNTITTYISNTEKALSDYMQYRTFESIDSYYHFQSLSEDSASYLRKSPSTDTIRHKEFIVYQLLSSFFKYSLDAVTSLRANNAENAMIFYKKSMSCYSMLLSQMEDLNMLMLQRNAEIYTASYGRYAAYVRLSIIFILILFSLILAILYLSLNIITKPLMDISHVANRVAHMDFDVPLFNNQDDGEIGIICRAFDRMIVSIREYVDKIWEKAAQENELREREMEMRELYADAQLRALQNQINPHFLFNTLNTGAQLAMMEGADKTCYFMEQVADFFRYNIQQKGHVATIDEELSLVDSYVYIMKVRFGDRVEFIKKVSSEKHETLLPRMTLQPLVENCMKYGLKEAKGIIEISVEKEVFQILIKISDNGCGFSSDLRKKILKAETPLPLKDDKTGTGTGLINVISRLRIYFHRNDVFDILTNEQGGTTFLLRIPNV